MLGPQQPNTTTTNLSVASPVDYWSQVGLAAQTPPPASKWTTHTQNLCVLLLLLCASFSKNHPKKKINNQKTPRETIELYRSAYNIQFYLSCLSVYIPHFMCTTFDLVSIELTFRCVVPVSRRTDCCHPFRCWMCWKTDQRWMHHFPRLEITEFLFFSIGESK